MSIQQLQNSLPKTWNMSIRLDDGVKIILRTDRKNYVLRYMQDLGGFYRWRCYVSRLRCLYLKDSEITDIINIIVSEESRYDD